MRNILLICSILLGPLFVAAGDGEREVPTTIRDVTVFRSGAQVFRNSEAVQLPAGNSILVFVGLTDHLVHSSLQVQGEGEFTVLSVSHRYKTPDKIAEDARREKINARKKVLEDSLRQLGDQQQIFSAEKKLLLDNNVYASAKAGVNLGYVREGADLQRARLTELNAKIFALEKIQILQAAEIVNLNKQLYELGVAPGKTFSEAVVAVFTKSAVTARFRVQYFVPQASWEPAYDLRVENVVSPMNLTCRALVKQRSGEDWNSVLLTLSTGDPSESGNRPALSPWYLFKPAPVAVYDKEIIRGSFASSLEYDQATGELYGKVVSAETGEALLGVVVSNMQHSPAISCVTDPNGNFRIRAGLGETIRLSYVGFDDLILDCCRSNTFYFVETAQLLDEVLISANISQEESETDKDGIYAAKPKRKVMDRAQRETTWPVAVQRRTNTTTQQFAIETPYTIPGDDKSYQADIRDMVLPAQYEYFCAPRLDPHAYLTARVINWDQYQLLSGEMHLYFEKTYVGKSYLDVELTTDTLVFSLGKDKNIVVKREKVKGRNTRNVLGNTQRSERNWQISVRNTKPVPVNLVIQDQFPLSTDNRIKIEDLNTGGAEHDKTFGYLTWRKTLSPGTSESVTLGYTVKYPLGIMLYLE